MRYLVLGLLAVIVGLVVAIIILAGSEGGTDQTGTPVPVRPETPDTPNDSGGVTPEPEPEPTPDPAPDGGGSGGNGGSSGGVTPGGGTGSSGGSSGGISP